MRVSQLVVVATLAAAAAPSAPSAAQTPSVPAASQPVFRAGVELLAVDVTALDSDGRQVTDLTAADLVADVDGKPREIVSVDYVALVDPRRPTMTAAERRVAGERAARIASDPYISANNKGAPPGRLILLIIDQGNIRSGGGRQAMAQARQFVDQLQPEDRVGVAAIPAPGDVLDFTTNHDRVKEALVRVHGTAVAVRRRFNVSITEAIAINQNSDPRLALDVLLRECGTNIPPADADRCERDLEAEAAEAVFEMRQQSSNSIRTIRAILGSLRQIEGSKQVILISEGLVLEQLTGDVDDLASLAADARASLDVLLLDVPAFDASQSMRPTTPRQDRALQEEGLESLAQLARGNLFRVTASAEYAFERITRALAGYYLLAVEAQPGDRDGKRHRISVKTTRKGVTLRTRRSVLSTMSGRGGTPAEAIARALRSPLPANDLPMRLSTWAFKEPGSTNQRLIVAVEVERGLDQSLDYITGLALIERTGRALLPEVATQTLSADGDPSQAVYVTSLLVEPGTYRLRVAMADSDGRVGSVERRVDAFLVDGTAAAMGDLLLGTVPADRTQSIAPAVEPLAAGSPLAALVEAYLPDAVDRGALEATLDVLRDEQSPVVMSAPMTAAAPRGADVAALEAFVNTAVLPPGRYLARATLKLRGTPLGHAIRPFRVEAAANGAAATTGVPPAFAAALVLSLTAYDASDMLSPAMTSAALALAEGRGSAAAGAVKEARAGQYGTAAMTALGDGDQVVAAFLKGLDLLAQGQAAPAATQFQNAMTQAPQFVPARVYLGAALARLDRHREAAGLLQSGASAEVPGVVGRVAGEEWLRAGEFGLAIGPLEAAAARPDAERRTKRALGIAYVLDQRTGDALPLLTLYLDEHPTDEAALLAGLYSLYSRHAAAPQPSLSGDRTLARTWFKAYAAAGGTLPLASAWITYLDALR